MVFHQIHLLLEPLQKHLQYRFHTDENYLHIVLYPLICFSLLLLTSSDLLPVLVLQHLQHVELP
ncbi:hypothetical protein AOA59_29520 [Pseudomonas sp. 2822-15]|nr:hypothetical protein AOA59_29520 [Pseudomonas sp. 2822-15]